METRQRRHELGVSLDEIYAALGTGFSRARLSAWERGLLRLEPWEIRTVESAIERIGKVRLKIQEVLDISRRIDLAELCADIREGRETSNGNLSLNEVPLLG